MIDQKRFLLRNPTKENGPIQFDILCFSREESKLLGNAIFDAIDLIQQKGNNPGSPSIELLYWHKNYEIEWGNKKPEEAKDYITVKGKYWPK